MPQLQSYVETNVRDVFETNSIEQTQDVQKKINYEIERKREELRMMVGERYRDLIDAADTIATMRTSSFNIFQKLTNLRTTFNELPTKATILRVNEGGQYKRNRNLSQEELEISVALKLSLDIPSAIQNFLEKEDVIPALHLTLLLTRWLNRIEEKYKWTFLHSARGNCADAVKASLANMCDFCEARLNASETSQEGLAECILAEHILTGTSVSVILSHWLAKKVLSYREAVNQRESEIVKTIAAAAEAIYSIFVDGNLYQNTANQIIKYKLEPSIFGLRITPRVFAEYNQSSLTIAEPPSITSLTKTMLEDFINPLTETLENETNHLSHFTTLAELQEYRQTSMKLFRERCEDLTRIVLGPSTSLWKHICQPVFQRRAESIAKKSIDEIIDFLRTTGYPKFEGAECKFDIIGFVWKAKSHVNSEGNRGTSIDTLKMKCLTPCLSQLCEDLEFRWSELVVDFLAMGDQSLKEFISANLLVSLKTFLDQTVQDRDMKTKSIDFSKACASFGRFTVGLLELCSTLWKLLEKSDGIQLKQELTSLGEKYWDRWGSVLLSQFTTRLSLHLSSLEPAVITSFMPMGELYEAASGENDEKIVPSVRVPVELTHSLHSLLFSICMEICKVGPQSIPKKVKDSLRINLAMKIIAFYKTLVGQHDTEEKTFLVTPQMSLQFIFDLKFLQWFHSSLHGKSDEVTLKLKSLIDSFDWDIVNIRMTSNLKRFLFENQLTLGLLFSEESHTFITQNFKTKQSLNFPVPTRHLLYNQLPLLPV